MRARSILPQGRGAARSSRLATDRGEILERDGRFDSVAGAIEEPSGEGGLWPGAERAQDQRFPERLATGTGQFEVPPSRLGPRGSMDEPISRIMSRKVVCARPEMDASLLRARLLERGVSGAPVVDDWGRVVGVASKTDLVEHEVTSNRGEKTVADVMMPMVFTLPADAPIGQAAALMAYEGVHRVVVVDERGCVAGVLSSLDIARWVGWCAHYAVGREP